MKPAWRNVARSLLDRELLGHRAPAVQEPVQHCLHCACAFHVSQPFAPMSSPVCVRYEVVQSMAEQKRKQAIKEARQRKRELA